VTRGSYQLATERSLMYVSSPGGSLCSLNNKVARCEFEPTIGRLGTSMNSLGIHMSPLHASVVYKARLVFLEQFKFHHVMSQMKRMGHDMTSQHILATS
jgi:hypothetical protein